MRDATIFAMRCSSAPVDAQKICPVFPLCLYVEPEKVVSNIVLVPPEARARVTIETVTGLLFAFGPPNGSSPQLSHADTGCPSNERDMTNFVFPCAPSDLSLYVTGTFRNAYVDVTAG